jgi:galactose oxidase-like protein
MKIYLKVIFAYLFIMQCASAAEPVYNGQPLSNWLLGQDATDQDAIRQIGTNGIPELLDILGTKQSTVKKIVGKLQNPGLQLEYREDKDANVDDFRSLAVKGFAALGTNAAPAIPKISKLLDDPETRFQAARALTKVGHEGFFVLTNDIAKHEEMRNNIIWAIAEEGGADPKVITELLRISLTDPDWTVRGNAADFLAHKDPAIAIPSLIPVLDDPMYYPKERATIALTSYGPAAKDAVPKLFSIFTSVVTGSDPGLAKNLGVTILDAFKEIDPETGAKAETFLTSNGGPLNFLHFGYTTTTLKSGIELIAGGYIHTECLVFSNSYLSSAELYDPKTGKWTETGEMNFARTGHTATLLHDGTVLVVGGSESKSTGGTYRDSHWNGTRYVPVNVPRATLLALASAELYNPSTRKWTETGSLTFGRFYHTATLQRDGKVLVEGGHDGRNPVSAKELYDPTKGTWTATTNSLKQ